MTNKPKGEGRAKGLSGLSTKKNNFFCGFPNTMHIIIQYPSLNFTIIYISVNSGTMVYRYSAKIKAPGKNGLRYTGIPVYTGSQFTDYGYSKILIFPICSFSSKTVYRPVLTVYKPYSAINAIKPEITV